MESPRVRKPVKKNKTFEDNCAICEKRFTNEWGMNFSNKCEDCANPEGMPFEEALWRKTDPKLKEKNV